MIVIIDISFIATIIKFEAGNY